MDESQGPVVPLAMFVSLGLVKDSSAHYVVIYQKNRFNVKIRELISKKPGGLGQNGPGGAFHVLQPVIELLNIFGSIYLLHGTKASEKKAVVKNNLFHGVLFTFPFSDNIGFIVDPSCENIYKGTIKCYAVRKSSFPSTFLKRMVRVTNIRLSPGTSARSWWKL